MEPTEKAQLRQEIGTVFTPASPVSEADLFAGRIGQLETLIDTIVEVGKHAILFGERGVGKTSLSNILSARLIWPGKKFYALRVNCDSRDTYTTMWKRLLDEFPLSSTKQRPGIRDNKVKSRFLASDLMTNDASPGEICRILEKIGQDVVIIPIFDEFDRLQSMEARRLMADTIKALSDHPSSVTIVIVGVADSVDELISEHESIERALVQVQMPRMSKSELEEVLEKGAARLSMQIDDSVKSKVAVLSRGLPHYTHLLGKHLFRIAVQSGRRDVQVQDVRSAIDYSIQEVQQSIRSTYQKATYSAHADAMYDKVLAACALAEANELGWFKATSVREPLSAITGKQYELPGYARHLGAFLQHDRGQILHREGKAHNYRYRFRNPLMQPFAVLKGIKDGYISEEIERLFETYPRSD